MFPVLELKNKQFRAKQKSVKEKTKCLLSFGVGINIEDYNTESCFITNFEQLSIIMKSKHNPTVVNIKFSYFEHCTILSCFWQYFYRNTNIFINYSSTAFKRTLFKNGKLLLIKLQSREIWSEVLTWHRFPKVKAFEL